MVVCDIIRLLWKLKNYNLKVGLSDHCPCIFGNFPRQMQYEFMLDFVKFVKFINFVT